MVFGGILRRNNHEGLIQGIGLVVERNLRFTHRFQQTTLCFRRRSIDFIRQHDIGEYRTRHKLKRLFLTVEYRDTHDIGRKQITRELNAFERAIERFRQTMCERRFSDSRYVFEEEMPACQERDQAHFDHLRFTLDDPCNILLDGSNDVRWIHDTANAWDVAVEWPGGRTRSKSNKGSGDGQLFKLFAPLSIKHDGTRLRPVA